MQYENLGNLALVLRCQLNRQKVNSNWIPRALSKGEVFCHEVSLIDKDPMTGFINPYAAEKVLVRIPPASVNSKYLIQGDDIIFAFKGTPNSIGKVGLMEVDPPLATPSLSCCIIRSFKGIDPLWLFHCLQNENIRKIIRENASGRVNLTVGLDFLRKFEIPLPSVSDLAKVHAVYDPIAEDVKEISSLRKKANLSIEEINSFLDERDSRKNFFRPSSRNEAIAQAG